MNTIQRTVQRVAASRSGGTFFRVTGIGAQDRLVNRMTGGRATVTGVFAGFPTVFVTTTGARTGRAHTVALIAVSDPERPGRLGLIASNFGQSHDPDWCRNLRASREATVADGGGGGERAYSCEEVTGAARDRWFALADELYLGYPAYRERAGRTIPVFELTPK